MTNHAAPGPTKRLPTFPPPRRLERALDLLFPPMCVGCRRVGRWICPRCWREVVWLVDERCWKCGEPSVMPTCSACSGGSSSIDRIIAVAQFEGTAREAVHALKYNGRHAISSMMGSLMAQAAHGAPADFVAHVPLHSSRMRTRGYDQSALLARRIARELTVPCQSDVLVRVRKTEQQAALDADERRRNVEGAFAAPRGLNGETVLLVDDVFTTGATMEATADALRSAGVEAVIGLVFAHAGW